jgi:hypothetical protein
MSYNFIQLKKDLSTKKSKRPELYMVGDHWGNSGWNFLYNIALGGQGTTENIHSFLKSIGPLLPCKDCSSHYDTYLNNTHLPNNHYEMFQWLQELENKISKKNNSKIINRYNYVQKNGKHEYSIKQKQDKKSKLQKKQIIRKNSNCKNCRKNKQVHSNNNYVGVGLNNMIFLRHNISNVRNLGKKI